MGKDRFISIYGAIFCVTTYIIYSILTIFFNSNHNNYITTGIIIRFVINAIIFGVCGIIFPYVQ